METLLNQLGAWIQPMLQSMDSGIERALATGQALPWVVSIGLALLLGALAGEVAVRLRMVRVQGYWMAGVVCACIWWAMQSQATSSSMNSPAHAITERWSLYRWVLDLALGWLLVQAGRRLDVQWLWRNRALLTCALLVWLFTAVGVSLVLIQAGVLWRDALIAGVIVAHASPVLVQAMSQSLRAEGQVSERSLQIAIIGLMLTALILPVTLMIRQNESWRSVVAITQPLLDACIAIGMGVILGAVVRWISEPPRGRAAMTNARLTDASPNMIYGPALVGAVLVIVGVAHWTEVPALPGCVALGWALRGRLSAHWRARKARQARLNLPMHSGPAPLLWP
jgi:Kef-type K+ transport system membrane component KefB